MTNTEVHATTLAQAAQNFFMAVNELLTATRRLTWALWKSLTQRQPPCPARTARQQADMLREYADKIYRVHPRRADDLYAAAARHELAAGKKS